MFLWPSLVRYSKSSRFCYMKIIQNNLEVKSRDSCRIFNSGGSMFRAMVLWEYLDLGCCFYLLQMSNYHKLLHVTEAQYYSTFQSKYVTKPPTLHDGFCPSVIVMLTIILSSNLSCHSHTFKLLFWMVFNVITRYVLLHFFFFF